MLINFAAYTHIHFDEIRRSFKVKLVKDSMCSRSIR